MLNSRIIAGKATLTIVAARIVETVPTMTVATTQARRCAAAEMALVRQGSGESRRASGDGEHDVGEFIPDVALTDALGQRVDPG